jgi:hypothetical protein
MVSLSNAAIRALPVYLGKTQCRVEDFFTVDGEASDELEIRGDAKQVKWIGRGMSRGRIKIVGNAGMHTGAYMKGGPSRSPGTYRTGSVKCRTDSSGSAETQAVSRRRIAAAAAGCETAPSSSAARRVSKSGCA